MPERLTAKSVESAQPKAERTEIADELLTGLYLVVQPSGAKSWAVRYRHGGKPRKHTLGRYPAIGLAEARTQAKDVLLRVATGEDPADTRARRAEAEATAERKERDKFGAVAALFIDKHAKPKLKTWRESEGILRRNVLPDWADRDIHAIRRRDVVELLDKVAERAPVQANRTLAVVRKLYNWALARSIVETSPCTGVDAPTAEKPRDRVLADDELVAIWTACDGLGWPFGPLVRLLILTGQRRDEVGGMAWSEIDLDRQTWTIPRARAKNGEPHDVWLAPAAVDLLRTVPRIAGCDLLFSTTGGRSAVSGYSRAKERLDGLSLRQLREAAGRRGEDPTEVTMSDWTLHDLRRTFATGLQRLGIRLEVTEAVLGHRSGSRAGIVGIYQRHSYAEERRAALEAWARFVGGLIEPSAENVVELRAAR